MYTVSKLKTYTAAALDKAVEKLLAALKEEAGAIRTEEEWKVFRDRWMARKNGVLTQINVLWLKAAPKDAKREVGQRVNEVKAKVSDVVEKRRIKRIFVAATDSFEFSDSVSVEVRRVDVTLPG